MTSTERATLAEIALANARLRNNSDDAGGRELYLGAAQVQATLAVAAAIIEATDVAAVFAAAARA